MSAQPTPDASAARHPTSRDSTSQAVVSSSASNEFIFAVVGHAGSGTSDVAKTLETLLREANFSGEKFDVETIKAREVIAEWALAHGEQLPDTHGPSKLPSVISFQNLGDKMRSALSRDGKPDHAAVARALIGKIRERRAALQNVTIEEDKPVVPDGHPRAYILDSVRHPEEVELLRRIYEDAFVLIGVVCEEERRRERLLKKYADAGRDAISKFMGRDASADEKAGQHVADAFHLSDFFVDNTANRTIDNRPILTGTLTITSPG